MADFRRFSLLPFPQYFDGGKLALNIVVLPRNQNPLRGAIELNEPDVPAAPAFADAQLSFNAKIISGLDGFPNTQNADFTRALVTDQPANARALFQQLGTLFEIVPLDSSNQTLPSLADAPTTRDRSIKK